MKVEKAAGLKFGFSSLEFSSAVRLKLLLPSSFSVFFRQPSSGLIFLAVSPTQWLMVATETAQMQLCRKCLPSDYRNAHPQHYCPAAVVFRPAR